MSKTTKVTVRCVTANFRPSPKPEDNVICYRFQQDQAPQGKPGDLLLESAVALYFHPNDRKFDVGTSYEISVEVSE